MSMSEKQLKADLHALLEKTELEVTDQQLTKLTQFLILIFKWNKAYNLTSVRDINEMMVKHIVDSVIVAPYLHGNRYIDVGTGPGLPGIPLAIMCPEAHFVLLDSLGKRVRFMKQAVFELKLENAFPVQSRVESYKPDEPFSMVLSRAFASIKDMLHWCEHLVDSSGYFTALKGQFPEQELAELPEQFEVKSIEPLSVPGLAGERHLVCIQKNN